MRALECIFLVCLVVVSSAKAADFPGGRVPWSAYDHKSWTATCDNGLTCTAFGHESDTQDPQIVARLSRGGAAADPPELLILIGDDTLAEGSSVVIEIDSPVKLRRQAEIVDGRLRFHGTEARALITAMAQGSKLIASAANGTTYRLPLDGCSAVLRWIDAEQHRVGSVTALVAKGKSAASTVPPPPVRPVVKRAKLPPQDNLPKTVPAIVLDTGVAKQCVDAADKSSDADYKAAVKAHVDKHGKVEGRLAPGLLLVSLSVPCDSGAYNEFTVYMIVSGSGLRYVIPDGQGQGDVLVNAWFDAPTAEIGSFAKMRGFGDCGSAQTYVWDGEEFRLTWEASMGECIGLPPDMWPVTYRAIVK